MCPNVKEYAKCWDVVIDSALVEPLEKETVILALGQETPEEWAANMDEYVKKSEIRQRNSIRGF